MWRRGAAAAVGTLVPSIDELLMTVVCECEDLASCVICVPRCTLEIYLSVKQTMTNIIFFRLREVDGNSSPWTGMPLPVSMWGVVISVDRQYRVLAIFGTFNSKCQQLRIKTRVRTDKL